jgi:hypothetical protein
MFWSVHHDGMTIVQQEAASRDYESAQSVELQLRLERFESRSLTDVR